MLRWKIFITRNCLFHSSNYCIPFGYLFSFFLVTSSTPNTVIQPCPTKRRRLTMSQSSSPLNRYIQFNSLYSAFFSIKFIKYLLNIILTNNGGSNVLIFHNISYLDPPPRHPTLSLKKLTLDQIQKAVTVNMKKTYLGCHMMIASMYFCKILVTQLENVYYCSFHWIGP